MKRFTKQLLLASLLLLIFGCRNQEDIQPEQISPATISEQFYDYQGNDPLVLQMVNAFKNHPKAEEMAVNLKEHFGDALWDLGTQNPTPRLNAARTGERANDSEGADEEEHNPTEVLVPLVFDHTDRVNGLLVWRRFEDGSEKLVLLDRQRFENLGKHQMMEQQPRLVAGYILAFENQLYGRNELDFNHWILRFGEEDEQQNQPFGTSCTVIKLYDPDTGDLISTYYFNCISYTVVITPAPEPMTLVPSAPSGGSSSTTYYDPIYVANPFYNPGGAGTYTQYNDDPTALGAPTGILGAQEAHRAIVDGPKGTDRATLVAYLNLIASELSFHQDTKEVAESILAAANDLNLNENDLFELAYRARTIYLETRLSNFNIDILSDAKHTSLAKEAAFIEVYPQLKEHMGDNGWPLDATEWAALWDVFKPLLAEVLIEAIPGGGITLAFRDLVQGAEARNIAVLTAGVVGLVLEFFPAGKFLKVVRKAGRAIKKGFKVVRHALKHLSTIARAMKKGLKLNLDGPVIKLTKNGDEVARISNNILEFNYTGFGGKITTNPNKTTTVIGKWQDPAGGGTAELIESGISKSGRNKGGINALSEEIPQGWDEVDIWDNVNEPWLREAAERGDAIRVISDPDKIENIYKGGAISNGLSFFGREVEFLKSLGYNYDPLSYTFKK